MTVLVQAIRGFWGSEMLRQRVVRMERFGVSARAMFESMKRTIALLQQANKQLVEQVAQYEAENRDLTAAVKAYQEATRKINPNAKCPGCGDENGHLTHAVKQTGSSFQVRVVNNCKTCGLRFVSAPPVAGEELVGQLYQPPTELLQP